MLKCTPLLVSHRCTVPPQPRTQLTPHNLVVQTIPAAHVISISVDTRRFPLHYSNVGWKRCCPHCTDRGTCLWQVSGRCEIGFTQWVRMDLWYIDHQSLFLDLVLLLKTPASVLSGRGAY